MGDTVTTIGERLEEARKRKGISIREAAEATKVRGDYLIAMEGNTFDINLPEIYARGFLKIYVNYLHLDVEKVMTDYDALKLSGRKAQQRLGAQSSPRKEQAPVNPGQQQSGRVSFGRMDIGEGPEPPEPQHLSSAVVPGGDRGLSEGLLPYLRPALVVAGVLLGIVLIALLVSSISGGSDKPAINPELAATQQTAPVASARPLQLIASDPVTVWVIRKSDNARVFEGTLAPGETQKVEVDGPVEIRYTNGQGLLVERDGQRLRMNTSGAGRSIVQ
ncbi:MAG: RodZ domain-containing protein [Opitutales bacterium]|jgi:transcriptional regulator with XRE-family HTH domain